jgi:hypothetical protein
VVTTGPGILVTGGYTTFQQKVIGNTVFAAGAAINQNLLTSSLNQNSIALPDIEKADMKIARLMITGGSGIFYARYLWQITAICSRGR